MDIDTLAHCIAQSVSPTVSSEERQLALSTYRAFREASVDNGFEPVLTLSAPPHLQLASPSLSTNSANGFVVRHGALLIVEYWIRLRWNQLSEAQRARLKLEAFLWINNAQDIVQEALIVKEAICRIFVEIAKREWPQNWLNLLPELFAIAECYGMAQAELVLLILLRLAEDVVQLRTLDEAPRRRKDIYQGLIDNTPALFNFFFKLLNAYYLPQNFSSEKMASRTRLLKSLLTTLTCYVEFVPLKELLLDEIFRILCFLLNDSSLRLQASNCLCEISARKFKGSDLEQLCAKFLRPEVMSEILRSIAGVLEEEKSTAISVKVEGGMPCVRHERNGSEVQSFLCALCGTLAGVSHQVSSYLLEMDSKFSCPASFVDLVQAVIQLCLHPSCVVARTCLSAATSLLKIEQKDSSKFSYPANTVWLPVCKMIRQRLVFNDYTYSVWDFEDLADLKNSYAKFKAELCDLLRIAVYVQPEVSVNVGMNHLTALCDAAYANGGILTPAATENSSIQDARQAVQEEWAGLHRYIETVCGALSRSICLPTCYRVPEEIGVSDNLAKIHQQLVVVFDKVIQLVQLQLSLTRKTTAENGELYIQSHVASCCTALSPFVVEDSMRLNRLLDVAFTMAFTEREGECRATRSKDVRDFRKHGTALFVRLCVDHSRQLFQQFDAIKDLICLRLGNATSNASISGLERRHYLEGLTVLSNQLTDTQCQLAFLEQVLSEELAFFGERGALQHQNALANVSRFAAFLGCGSVEAFEAEPALSNRIALNSRLMTITGVLKRCRVVNDCHPAFDLVASKSPSVIISVLKLVWLFKELLAAMGAVSSSEQSSSLNPVVHPDIVQSILCLGESDKFNLFGENVPSCEFPAPKNPIAQAFMTVFQDLISQCVVAFSYRPEFYHFRPDVGSIILGNFGNLPSYKMHLLIHSMVKPFVKNCPDTLLLPQLSSTFIPLVSVLFGYLNAKWQNIFRRNDTEVEGLATEATLDELIDDQVTHQMSRDLIEIISILLLDSSRESITVQSGLSEDSVSGDSASLGISSFGDQLLADAVGRQCAVTVSFSALQWSDTSTSYKALPVCTAIVQHLVQRYKETHNPVFATFVFGTLLVALRVHGDNDTHAPLLLTLGVNLYKWLTVAETLKVVHACHDEVTETHVSAHHEGHMDSTPSGSPHDTTAVSVALRSMLLEAGCDSQALKRFENSLAPGVNMPQRKRKDLFRSLVNCVIGKSISEKGKEIVRIECLAPLWKAPKYQHQYDILDSNIEHSILSNILGS